MLNQRVYRHLNGGNWDEAYILLIIMSVYLMCYRNCALLCSNDYYHLTHIVLCVTDDKCRLVLLV